MHKITWMRSILRLEVMADPFEWDDAIVVMAFAARGNPAPISYENWCLKMGLDAKAEKEQEENEAALSQMKAAGLQMPNISIVSAERPE